MLRRLIVSDERKDRFQVNLRVLALVILMSTTGLLCALPLLLDHFGSSWKPIANHARTGSAQQHGTMELAR
jgi:hypothetical protein